MAATKRIYKIEITNEGQAVTTHLIKATSASVAIRKLLEGRATANVATQDDIVNLMGAGVKVEEV